MTRALAGLASLISLVLAAWFCSPTGDGAGGPVRTVVAVAALVGFATRIPLRVLVWAVPLGPVLDALLLPLGRTIYLTEILVLAAGAAWALGAARGRSGVPRPSAPILLLSAFGLFGGLALLLGSREAGLGFAGLRGLRVLWVGPLLGWMWAALDADPDRRCVHWARASLGALVLLAGAAAVQFATGDRSAEPGSFYGSSVGLAVHLAFMMPLALAVALGESERRARILAGTAWLLGLVVLPLTASRGALGATALTTLLVLMVSTRRLSGGRRTLTLALLGLVLVGGTALVLKPDLAGESFAYKFEKSMTGDFLSTRTDAWSETWQAVKETPWTGEGADAWSPSIPLELARRYGLPAAGLALAAVLTALVTCFLALPRLRRGEGCIALDSVALGLGAGLLGLMLVGLAETGWGARSTPLITAALATAGTLAGMGRKG